MSAMADEVRVNHKEQRVMDWVQAPAAAAKTRKVMSQKSKAKPEGRYGP